MNTYDFVFWFAYYCSQRSFWNLFKSGFGFGLALDETKAASEEDFFFSFFFGGGGGGGTKSDFKLDIFRHS